MPEKLIHAITNLGDSAVTGTLALSLAIYLLAMREKRAALAVVVSFGVAALAITVGKIVIYSRCDPFDASLDLRSPSGHTATAIAVYGMFAALVASSRTGRRRIIPYLVAVPLIAFIAASRVILNYHTTSDVVAGLIAGLLACLGAWRLIMREKRVCCRWWPFVLIALIVLGVLYGLRLPAEALISHLSTYIREHFRVC